MLVVSPELLKLTWMTLAKLMANCVVTGEAQVWWAAGWLGAWLHGQPCGQRSRRTCVRMSGNVDRRLPGGIKDPKVTGWPVERQKLRVMGEQAEGHDREVMQAWLTCHLNMGSWSKQGGVQVTCGLGDAGMDWQGSWSSYRHLDGCVWQHTGLTNAPWKDTPWLIEDGGAGGWRDGRMTRWAGG